MRALVVSPPGLPLDPRDLAIPEPGHGEVLVKVGRCGICGTDLHRTAGHAAPGSAYAPGTVIGHEWAGEIVDVGPSVVRVKIGDVVAGVAGRGCGSCAYCAHGDLFGCANRKIYIGGFAQYMITHQEAGIILPKSLSLTDGALIEPLAVGLHGVKLSDMHSGSRILVLGSGGVALSTIFWSKWLGAAKIVVLSRSYRRAEMALAMGADSVVIMGEDEGARVNAALGGEPDIVFECVGVPGMLGKSIDHVRFRGIIVSLGFCSEPDPVIPELASRKQAALRFALGYTIPEFEHCARALDGELVPTPSMMVSASVNMDQFPAMFESLRGATAQTKVQLDPWA